jgi:hypothetical protein
VRRALIAAAGLALALPASAAAGVEPGVYEGVVTTGAHGTVTLTVTDNGNTVDASFSGLGTGGKCSGVGFDTGPIPLVDGGFSYTANGGQVTASGTITRSSAGGSAQVLNTPCTTGSQTWLVVSPDAAFDLFGLQVGIDVFHPKAKGQTITDKKKRGESSTALMKFYNSGPANDSYQIKGCDRSKTLKPKYTNEVGINVTDQVVAGTYETEVLAPEHAHDLTLKLKVLKKAKPGKVQDCRVTADNGLLIDTIGNRITVKKG